MAKQSYLSHLQKTAPRFTMKVILDESLCPGDFYIGAPKRDCNCSWTSCEKCWKNNNYEPYKSR